MYHENKHDDKNCLNVFELFSKITKSHLFAETQQLTMKKILFFVIASTLVTNSFSQVKWGVQVLGGLNTAHISGLDDDDEFIKKKSVAGFGAGVIAEVSLGKEFTLRPSLNLLKKGVSLTLDFSEPSMGYIDITELKTNLYYAELPLNLTYNGPLKSGKYFIGVGPSFGVGLFGTAKTNSTYQDPGQPLETDSEEVDAFKSEDDDGAGFKRFEVSANFIGGVQFNNGFFINAGYLLGMTNTIPNDDGASYKNKGLNITVGMFFKRKK